MEGLKKFCEDLLASRIPPGRNFEEDWASGKVMTDVQLYLWTPGPPSVQRVRQLMDQYCPEKSPKYSDAYIESIVAYTDSLII